MDLKQAFDIGCVVIPAISVSALTATCMYYGPKIVRAGLEEKYERLFGMKPIEGYPTMLMKDAIKYKKNMGV